MSSIKNIILDFGGVVIDIDYQRCIEAFRRLGFTDFDRWYSQLRQDHLFDDLETGRIGPEAFRDKIREALGRAVPEDIIDDAWNAILLRLRPKKVKEVMVLKKRFRLFLLSNTNIIHEKEFTRRIIEDYGRNILPELFEGVYFSHDIHLRKPHAEIYDYVVRENNLQKSETLFVDDSPQHVEGAIQAGLHGILYKPGMRLDEIG